MNKEQLKSLPTSELDELLQAELRRDIPDGDLVREILRVLEEREPDQNMEITPQIQAAWDKFNQTDQWRTERPEPTARSWVKKTATAVSMAAMVCFILLVVIPQPAQADTLWERIMRFTDSVFEFVSWRQADEKRPEYEFKTDNPGLQEVYEAVVELGVTDPVVPTWLPDGYELEECVTVTEASKNSVYARFVSEGGIAVYKAEVYDDYVWHEYHKDEADITQYETDGVVHNVMQNVEKNIAIWTKGNVECFLSVDCEMDDLYKMLDSIYAMEDYE